jgi:hypothetical protein
LEQQRDPGTTRHHAGPTPADSPLLIGAADAAGIPKYLLIPRDAAHVLAVSERTLWGLTYPRGPIRAVRILRAVRYDPADLAAFIAGQKGARDE